MILIISTRTVDEFMKNGQIWLICHEGKTGCYNFNTLHLAHLYRMHSSHEDVSLNDPEVLFQLAGAVKYV
jgi:hypothetical protein